MASVDHGVPSALIFIDRIVVILASHFMARHKLTHSEYLCRFSTGLSRPFHCFLKNLKDRKYQ